MYLAFKGCRNCYRNQHDDIFMVTFVGYFLVGVGSFLFHSTLKCRFRSFSQAMLYEKLINARHQPDPMQLIDELSMIYTTCLMCYATFAHGRAQNVRVLLGVSLVALAAFITLYYHYLQDPAFHQNAYALLTLVIVIRSLYLMISHLHPRSQANLRANRAARNGGVAFMGLRRRLSHDKHRNKDILRSMWLLVGFGLTIFVGGFGIWSLDNRYCSQLRRWRRQIGLPWGMLLEGHGWW